MVPSFALSATVSWYSLSYAMCPSITGPLYMLLE